MTIRLNKRCTKPVYYQAPTINYRIVCWVRGVRFYYDKPTAVRNPGWQKLLNLTGDYAHVLQSRIASGEIKKISRNAFDFDVPPLPKEMIPNAMLP